MLLLVVETKERSCAILNFASLIFSKVSRRRDCSCVDGFFFLRRESRVISQTARLRSVSRKDDSTSASDILEISNLGWESETDNGVLGSVIDVGSSSFGLFADRLLPKADTDGSGDTRTFDDPA